MWERFTERAKFTVAAAREEAIRLGSEYVRTEHILMGLCREPNGLAARVLENLGVDIEAVAMDIEASAKRSNATTTGEALSFTPRAKKVLELAVDEASKQSDVYFSTEHILLGLIRESESPAAQLLAEHGVTYDSAQVNVIQGRKNRET